MDVEVDATASGKEGTVVPDHLGVISVRQNDKELTPGRCLKVGNRKRQERAGEARNRYASTGSESADRVREPYKRL